MRHDLATLLACVLRALDRARAVGDAARVRVLAGHVAAMGAAAVEVMLCVTDECAAMAAGSE